ncbi:MAG: PsbP-related protein [Waterburya sp.]
MESIVGKILCDRYRIIQELSPGSHLLRHQEDLDPWTTETAETFIQDNFYQVYLAEDRSQHSKVQCIIERLQPSYDNEVLGSQSWQKVLPAFLAQGKVLQNLSQHPQIPQLLDFFECDRDFYLVHEHIEGQSLGQKLDSNLIDEAEALVWLREIIGVLEFSHKLGLAHLNIQPSSLIEHQDGRKFLTNFALFQNPLFLNSQGSQNTIHSISPPSEPAAKPDYSADIHALGKTIIFALTGNFAPSIQAKSADIKEYQKLENSENSSIANIRPELANVLNKMVDKYPDKCYQSVAEVLADLDFEQNVITFPPPFFNSSHFSSPPSRKGKNIDNNQVKAGNSKFKNIDKYIEKIIWLLLALPFAVAAVIIFIGINKNSYKKFAHYVNNDYQFAIKYPQNWSQRQLDDPITGEVVVFDSPLETNTDLFIEKVSIAVEYLPSEPTSLEQYTQTVFERINQTEDSEIEVYEDYKTSIDKSPARKVIYSRQEGGLQLKQMETFTIKNNQVYIAIYTAERAKFSKFYSTVDKIINSWEIQ